MKNLHRHGKTNQSGLTRLLLVDDQIIVAEAIRQMLHDEEDISFECCINSQEAIQSVTTINPTVILQDLIMPGIDGMELLRAYKTNKKTSNIPVIILSTKEDPLDKSNAFESGASDYLVKLPDKIELVARIRAHSKSYLAQLQRDEAFEQLKILKEKLRQSNAELQRLSRLDGLTGIANRRHFDTYLEQEWYRAIRENTPVSLILADLDYFKPYNDNYGHQMGDETLRTVAQHLESLLQRPGDLVARYGGEEFVIVLPNTNRDGAQVIANTIHKQINALRIEHQHSKNDHILTVSMGVATIIPSTHTKTADLIRIADDALYNAKNKGRNQYTISSK